MQLLMGYIKGQERQCDAELHTLTKAAREQVQVQQAHETAGQTRRNQENVPIVYFLIHFFRNQKQNKNNYYFHWGRE